MEYIKEGQKWKLQSHGMWSDTEKEESDKEDKMKYLYETRLTSDKADKINEYMTKAKKHGR